MIRDRIVFGTNSAKIREKLINEGEKITLDKAIQIAQNYEYSKEQLKSMGTTSQEVHTVTSRLGNRDFHRMYKTGHSTRQSEPKLTLAIAMHPVNLNARTVDTNIPKRKSALRMEQPASFAVNGTIC